MQRIYTDYKGKLRAGNISLFLQISIDLYLEVLEINNAITKFEDDKHPGTIPDVEKYFEEQEEIIKQIFLLKKKKYKITLQGIIMLAAYFESLINEIGIIELGSKYYSENLDRLSVQAKWEVVLKLIYSQTINKDSMEYEALNKIIIARNKILHYKTKSIRPLKEDLDSVHEFEKKMMDLFESTIRALKPFHSRLLRIDNEKKILESADFQIELLRI